MDVPLCAFACLIALELCSSGVDVFFAGIDLSAILLILAVASLLLLFFHVGWNGDE